MRSTSGRSPSLGTQPSSVTISSTSSARRQVEERRRLGVEPRRVADVDRRELERLGGDDDRNAALGRRVRQEARADLVAEAAVAEHGVGAEEEQGRTVERGGAGLVRRRA